MSIFRQQILSDNFCFSAQIIITENRCITLQYSTGFKPVIIWKISLIQLLDKYNHTPIAIEDSFQLNLFDNLLGH